MTVIVILSVVLGINVAIIVGILQFVMDNKWWLSFYYIFGYSKTDIAKAGFQLATNFSRNKLFARPDKEFISKSISDLSKRDFHDCLRLHRYCISVWINDLHRIVDCSISVQSCMVIPRKSQLVRLDLRCSCSYFYLHPN